MKNPQSAKVILALAIALVFSNCSSPNEPFFRYNSPFEKEGLLGYDRPENRDTGGAYEGIDTPSDFENEPTPSFAADNSREPELSELFINNDTKEENRSIIKGPDNITAPDTSPAPEIYVHKRGPAGSTCYTCRGKGYVFQPTTSNSGDNHKCPSCGGDGRY